MNPPNPREAPAAAVPLRIRHVDSLRAVAAGLVIWFHFDQTLYPLAAPGPAFFGFLHTLPHVIDMGRFGVMMFFAVSGFVIYRSFDGPRAGGARRFLVRRFCRLYPAFWVSLLGGLLAWRLNGEIWTWTQLAANTAMVPGWLGQRHLLGVYWTLEIELLFYGACLALYLARSLERRWLLAALVVALAGLPRLLRLIDHQAGTHLQLALGKPTLLLSLAVMFWGALFRRAYDETGGFRRSVWRCPGTWSVAALAQALVDLPDPNVKWFLLGRWHGPWPGHLAVLAALLVFTVWVAALRVDQPVLTYLGVISYSLYLFHPVTKYAAAALLSSNAAVQGWGLPWWVYLGAGAAVTTGLAMAVYRWVERPAIALGKRWAGSRPGQEAPGRANG